MILLCSRPAQVATYAMKLALPSTRFGSWSSEASSGTGTTPQDPRSGTGPRLPSWTKGRSTLGGKLSPLLEKRQEVPQLEAASYPHNAGESVCRQKQEGQNFESQSTLDNSVKVMMRK